MRKNKERTLILNVTIEGIINESFYPKRKDVIKILPNGCKVPVHIFGTVGTVTFEGLDTIRVIK